MFKRKPTKRDMSTKRIRELWAALYGPIPVDENGVTFDIHHVDFNPNNNAPSNWKALSIADHYQVHRDNKDWYSALLISYRLKKKPNDLTAVIENVVELTKKRTLSAEARENIAAAKRGTKWTPEQRIKMKDINKGRKHSAEAKAKMSAAQKGRKASPEAKKNMSLARIGKKYPVRKGWSQEAKDRQSAAKMGKPLWPNGRVITPEWRANMSKANRGKVRWPNGRTFTQEGMGAMRAAAMKKKPRTPEVNAAIMAKRFATIAAKKAAQQLSQGAI